MELVLNSNSNVDQVICVGDVVNYGPWSNECVQLLDSVENHVAIKGNHEVAFLNGKYNGTNLIAKAFFDHCYPSFTCHKIISNYLEEFTLKGNLFKHTLEEQYIFPDTDIDIECNIFIGHSHKLFLKYLNGFRLVNVGSVGQNRTNINVVEYVIWDSNKDTVKLRSQKIDSNILLNEMKAKKYPELCYNYIKSKL
jgi:predicted phosphodiesterase